MNCLFEHKNKILSNKNIVRVIVVSGASVASDTITRE
uniref:Uncharacterized protein n=1 Tax=Salmonella phage vB_SEnST11_KE23 TaxID=3161174 RepID=A0AAU8GIN3_9CAUD